MEMSVLGAAGVGAAGLPIVAHFLVSLGLPGLGEFARAGTTSMIKKAIAATHPCKVRPALSPHDLGLVIIWKNTPSNPNKDKRLRPDNSVHSVGCNECHMLPACPDGK